MPSQSCPVTSPIDDPDYWRDRAGEARAMADIMRNPDSKRTMLDIAKGYDQLAITSVAAARPKNGAPSRI